MKKFILGAIFGVLVLPVVFLLLRLHGTCPGGDSRCADAV